MAIDPAVFCIRCLVDDLLCNLVDFFPVITKPSTRPRRRLTPTYSFCQDFGKKKQKNKNKKPEQTKTVVCMGKQGVFLPGIYVNDATFSFRSLVQK